MEIGLLLIGEDMLTEREEKKQEFRTESRNFECWDYYRES